MPPCCCDSTECYDAKFDDAQAAEDLRSYRSTGPGPTTRLLLDALRAEGVEGATLLDVGGGVGVVQHELMGAGVRHAVHVDAARPYVRGPRITLQHERVVLATAERRVDVDLWFAARPARGGSIRDVPYGLAFLHFVRTQPHVLDFYARVAPRLGPGTPDELRERLLARFERSYAEWLPALRAAYRELFAGMEYDAVLRPPSRRDDARPYLEEACAARPDAFNLSLGLSQVPADGGRPPRAGHKDERPGFRGSLRVDSSLRTVLPSIERLLIVDDTFADGTTIAGWWEALRAAGLPPSTRLVAACPLRTTAAAT